MERHRRTDPEHLPFGGRERPTGACQRINRTPGRIDADRYEIAGGKKPLTVTLHGAGGIGKTALLWQALQRFAPSFEATLAIGLDPLPSLESILGRIEHFLGLPSPCSMTRKNAKRWCATH